MPKTKKLDRITLQSDLTRTLQTYYVLSEYPLSFSSVTACITIYTFTLNIGKSEILRTLSVNDCKQKMSLESSNGKVGEENLEISILIHLPNSYNWATCYCIQYSSLLAYSYLSSHVNIESTQHNLYIHCTLLWNYVYFF